MGTAIQKAFTFEAAHHLPNHEGKCKGLHGHSYQLEVKISGALQPEPQTNAGMVMDFGDLKDLVNDLIIDKFDHQDLNIHFDNPTAEIMANWIFQKIDDNIPSTVRLVKVLLWETGTAFVEVTH